MVMGGGQQANVHGLSRQGSIYTLTLNEVQSHLGEPLHSMNLDDLLRHVLPSATDFEANTSASGIISMPRALSKKTVDEVWRGIQQGQRKHGGGEPPFGEMTLEDFLAKAGLASDGSELSAHWIQQYYHNSNQCQNYHDGVGAVFDPQTPGRKRGAAEDAAAEKTVERRQKRMIKNRESAARSRARKQAYTNELENKVSRLEEENERLRKQQELEPVIHYVPQPESKCQLRRTSSAPF
ncbi:ABSCISIC ACID-INSENSITIVE 5-like protein 2 [Typha latifolia]|uniref:ABSCISIC ACID-INSENSITIVE 5-like protein 2 n=1 Tax=Typha latifolia TaxID=4733 RepID=UPI003C2C9634